MSSPPRSRIRTARPGDDSSLRQIDIATWTVHVSPAPPPAADASFFENTACADVLVAEIDRKVVGYVKLGPFYKITTSSHVLEIQGIAIAPEHQRRGIGRQLIQAAIAFARQRDFRKLMLRVLSSNQPARTLYETCGFNTEAILREQFLLDGNYVDDVFMAIHLAT